MITCKEATKRISQLEEGKLSLQQRIQLWMHLAVCSFCKLFYRQNKVIIDHTKHFPGFTNAILSPAEKESLINTLEKGT